MARILIISLVFAPDGVSTATLISELALSLTDLGHEIRVITTVPHYNYDAEARAKQPLQSRAFGLYSRSRYHNIDVWHTTVVSRGERAGRRMIGYLIFNFLTLLIGLFIVGRQEIVMVVSPPLTSGVVGWILGRLKRAKTIYNVQELYPDTFIEVGSMRRDSTTARILYAIERFVYRSFDVLTPISESFAQTIREKGVSPARIHVIPNFADTRALSPRAKANPFSQEHGLIDEFVILYAGNIGMTQSFETLMEVARRMSGEAGIRFLIVGDGVRRKYVEEMVAARQLTNVTLLPYQPSSAVPDIYASADIGLVPLMAGTAKTTLPSKLYTIMASGRAVLVAVDADSDIVQTVKDAKAGLIAIPDDVNSLEQAIRRAYAEREQLSIWGENGHQYVEAHFSRDAITHRYHELFLQLIAAGDRP
jgi:colanic acid biosynthesis glycosyl transferase WcaI